MVQTKTPIGEIIFSIYQVPNRLEDGNLRTNLTGFVEKLKEIAPQVGLVQACAMLEDQLFNLRFDLLEYIIKRPDFLEEVENSILNGIGSHYFSKDQFAELHKAVGDSLDIYLLMFGKWAKDIADHLDDASVFGSFDGRFTISSLRHAYSLQPLPGLKRAIEWFQASVQYDFYLIFAELLFADSIEILPGQGETSLLPTLIRQAIVDFGAYTALSGFWMPKSEDESPLMRNIKIRAAALSLQWGGGTTVPFDALKNILH